MSLLICFYVLFKMYYVVMTSQPPTQPTPEGPTGGGSDKGDKDKAH
jgi:hypothetical protein